MRTSIYALLVLSLFSLLTACTDHVTPEPDKVYPTLETLVKTSPYDGFEEGVDAPEEDFDFEYYHLKFTSLGNQPVTEYGVVMRAVQQNDQTEPTLTDTKRPFTSPAAVGTITETIPFSETPTYPTPEGVYRFSYRAYAITADGTVIYGNTISEVVNIL